MRGNWFTAGLLAAVGVLIWAVPSRAGDVVRLNLAQDAPTTNLVDDGQGADTVRTWYRGFGYGGYRGFGGYGLGYRGFGYGGYGLGYRGFGFGGYGLGYRGFGLGGYGLGYRSFGYGGFYRPFGYGLGYGLGGLGFGGLGYGGFGYGGIGYGGFYPGFGYGYGFGPCAGATAPAYNLAMPVATLGTPLNGAPNYLNIDPPQAPADAGTYPYDGGPRRAVPAPAEQVQPSRTTPQRTVPMEGRTVSLPKASGKWSYPAYGETARRTSPAREQTVLTRGQSKRAAPR